MKKIISCILFLSCFQSQARNGNTDNCGKFDLNFKKSILAECDMIKEYRNAEKLNQEKTYFAKSEITICSNGALEDNVWHDVITHADEEYLEYSLSAPVMTVRQEKFSSFKEDSRFIEVKTRYTGYRSLKHIFKYNKKRKTLYIKKIVGSLFFFDGTRVSPDFRTVDRSRIFLLTHWN